MTAEQEVRVGQVWRRKKDGQEVRVVEYEPKWEDVRIRPVGGGRKRPIYSWSLRRLYQLIGDTP